MTHAFDHGRLDVYQVAIKFVVTANDIVENLPRGQSHLADQLQRASTSVPLNIAEGAGETSAKEKARFLSHGSQIRHRLRCHPGHLQSAGART